MWGSDHSGENSFARGDIVAAAAALSSLGFVHAFGHVSARASATSILITPTRPSLSAQQPADILEVGFDGTVLSGDSAHRPIEVFLHLGVYQARADVGAICRAHPPAASLCWGDAAPPIQHGFGGIVGAVGTYGDSDLVHNERLGAAAAQSLGMSGGLLLRGNGALTVGGSVGEAVARMWSLEERCSHALRQPGAAIPFSEEDLRLRARWYAAEADRHWSWLKINKIHGGGAQ